MRHLIIIAVALAALSPANAQFAEPNHQGVAFGHVHVVVADLELHKKLWPEIFDVELVEKEGYSAVRVSNALVFFREGEPTAPSSQTAIDHFGLEVRDIGTVLSKWRASGYEVDSAATDASGVRSAYITMPGGIRLELRENASQAATTAMGYVQFVAPEHDELKAWYERRFGATTPTDGSGNNTATVPGSGLRFSHTEKMRLPTDGAAIDHIGFEIEEWQPFVETLENNNVQFEFGPVHIESLDLWVAFFNDPGGVLVEITHGLDHF